MIKVSFYFQQASESEDVQMEDDDDDMDVNFGVFSIINLTGKKVSLCPCIMKSQYKKILEHCELTYYFTKSLC